MSGRCRRSTCTAWNTSTACSSSSCRSSRHRATKVPERPTPALRGQRTGCEGPPCAPSSQPASPAGPALEDGGPRAGAEGPGEGAPVPPARCPPHLQCTRRGPAPTVALACSRTSSTKASRELGASGTLWSGQVVNCSCFTLRCRCWAAWGGGGAGVLAQPLSCHQAPRAGWPLPPGVAALAPPASSESACRGCPGRGAPLPQEVTAQEADGARGPEPSTAQAETSFLSRPRMTLSLHSAARPFRNHQPPGQAGGQRPRGGLTLPKECSPLPSRART